MSQIAIDHQSKQWKSSANPIALDVLAAFENKPEELDFIWPGFLSGSVGALVAPGASGKSIWALQAAMAVSSVEGDLLELSPTRVGPVLYLAGEDPLPALQWRLHAIGSHLSRAARLSIASNLVVETVMGQQFNIMAEHGFSRLALRAEGYRLIVLDTLSRIHQLDENNNGDMSRLIVRLEQLATTTGASVLYLHHASKGSVREGQLSQQQAARGASALIDNARWCGYIVRMSEDESKRLSDQRFGRTSVGPGRRGHFIRFGISKQNYGAEYSERWYQRQDGGVLLPATLLETSSSKSRGKHRNGI